MDWHPVCTPCPKCGERKPTIEEFSFNANGEFQIECKCYKCGTEFTWDTTWELMTLACVQKDRQASGKN